MANWWSKRFAVERVCTCRPGQRGAECGARGYHVVDSHDDLGSALADAGKLRREVGVDYRVINQPTGEVVS